MRQAKHLTWRWNLKNRTRRQTQVEAAPIQPKQPQAAAASTYMTVAEAAELLKLSEISIRRYLTNKILVRYKVGDAKRGRTLLRRDDVERLIKQA